MADRRRPSTGDSQRRLKIERLEDRVLLANDLPFQNPAQAFDVNRDLRISALDALQVINVLERFSNGEELGPVNDLRRFPDVNGSDSITALDALQVINRLAAREPKLAARLVHDSAPNDTSNLDFLTNNYALEFGISFGIGGEQLEVRIDGLTTDPFFPVIGELGTEPLLLDENALNELAGSPLADGLHRIEARLVGEVEGLSFDVEVDRAAPSLRVAGGSTVRVASDPLRIEFAEPFVDVPFDRERFTLTTVSGGAGPTIASASPSLLGGTRLVLSDPLIDQDYRLSVSGEFTDLAGNVSIEPTATFLVADPTGVTEFRPTQGERSVRLTREVRINLDEPIDPTTVDASNFFVVAAGEIVPGRLTVGSDGESVTLFPDSPIPAATRVRLVVDGDQILGTDGLPLDADGDNEPGGRQEIEFTTLSLTRIPGTSVAGRVLDSTSSSDTNKVPIAGVTLRVEGIPELTAVTDADGFFILEDTPAGEFYVEIDVSTATGAPQGFHYVGTSKPFHPVAGQATQLIMNGVPFDIHLPLARDNDTVAITAGETTVAQFSPTNLDTLASITPNVPREMWELLSVEIPPDSLAFDDGTPATDVQIFPLATDRIPAPVPPGLDPAIVFSVDALGAENFDIPARVTYPNVDGLDPGEKSFIYSFDHDQGKWRPTGTMTVSEDGTVLTSDEGVQTVGWRLVSKETGTKRKEKVKGHTAEKVTETGFKTFRFATASFFAGSSTALNAIDVVEDYMTLTADVIPGVGSVSNLVTKPIDLGLDALSISADVAADSLKKGELDVSGTTIFGGALSLGGEAASFIPVAGPVIDAGAETAAFVVSTVSFLETVGQTGLLSIEFSKSVAEWADRKLEKTIDDVSTFVSETKSRIESTYNKGLQAIRLTKAATQAAVDYFRFFDEATKWADHFNIPFTDPGEGERVVDPAIASPSFSIAEGEFTPEDQAVIQRLIDAIETMNRSIAEVTQFGYATLGEAVTDAKETIANLNSEFSEIIGPALSPSRGAYFAIDLADDIVIRGRMQDNGEFDVVLPPDSLLPLTMYDPTTGFVAETFIQTGQSGSSSAQQSLILQVDENDADGDGIPDLGEHVVGTRADLADTDSDGITDLAELLAELNPLDGTAYPSGIIGSLVLQGNAQEVVVTGSVLDTLGQTAYVATGSHGLSIVDLSEAANPILLGQIDLPGESTDVVIHPTLGLAAVASGSAGIHLVDVADPLAPVVTATIQRPGTVTRVEMRGETIYAGGSELSILDLRSGELLRRLDFDSPLTDLAIEGAIIAVTTANNRLHVIDTSSGAAVVRGSVMIGDQASRVFLGNRIAYVSNGSVSDLNGSPLGSTLDFGGYTTVDIRNLDAPAVIAPVQTPSVSSGNLKTVTNGSGLALIAGGFRGLEVFDASDNGNTFDFLRQFETPGTARSVAIAGGMGIVADGPAGLQVVNYADFDAAGVPPSVTVDVSSLDADLTAPGIQIVEGSTISVLPSVEDDVQVRNVKLMMDGDAIAKDVAFPFDFTIRAPRLTAQQTTTSIQVFAIDTGGNMSGSQLVELELLPDSTPPVLSDVTPSELGLVGRQTIDLVFDESLDPDRIDVDAIELIHLDNPGNQITPTSVTLRGFDRTVQFNVAPLASGQYELRIDQSQFADRAGNLLGETVTTRSFEMVEATAVWIRPDGGLWNDPANWRGNRLPTPDDGALVILNEGAQIVHPAIAETEVARLIARGEFVLSGGRLNAGVFDVTHANLRIEGGQLANTIVIGEGDPDPIEVIGGELSGVTLNVPAIIQDGRGLDVRNGLTVNNTLIIASAGATTDLEFIGSQTVGGSGQILFGGTPDNNNDNRLIASGPDSVLTVGKELTVGLGRGHLRGFGFGAVIDVKGNITPGPNGSIDLFDVTNGDGTLTLNAPTGGLTVHTPLQNLTVDGTAGTIFEMGGSGITFDNVTLQLPVVVRDGQTMTVVNDLAIRDEILIDGAGSITQVDFRGDQTLSGTGFIRFNSQQANRVVVSGAGAVLTVDQGVTVGLGRGRVLATNGGMIDLRGKLVPGPEATDIVIARDLTNSNGVLQLDAPDGRLLIESGLRDLRVTGTPGTRLEMSSFGITLDNVVLDLPGIVQPGQTLTVVNGLTINDEILLNASATSSVALTFDGTQTVDGTGTVRFGGSPDGDFDNVINATGSGTVVTIGPSITLGEGRGALRKSIGFDSTFVVLGTVRSNLGSRLNLANVDLSAATVVIEIDATDSGRLVGVGSLALPSVLSIERPTSAIPAVGQEFTLLEFTELTGAIDTILGNEFESVRLSPSIADGVLKLIAESV